MSTTTGQSGKFQELNIWGWKWKLRSGSERCASKPIPSCLLTASQAKLRNAVITESPPQAPFSEFPLHFTDMDDELKEGRSNQTPNIRILCAWMHVLSGSSDFCNVLTQLWAPQPQPQQQRLVTSRLKLGSWLGINPASCVWLSAGLCAPRSWTECQHL